MFLHERVCVQTGQKSNVIRIPYHFCFHALERLRHIKAVLAMFGFMSGFYVVCGIYSCGFVQWLGHNLIIFFIQLLMES